MASGTSKDKPTPKGFIAAPRKQDPVEKLIQNVTNRYRVTAREARDIITAAGTVGRTVVDNNIVPKNGSLKGKGLGTGNKSRAATVEAAVRNTVKQVGETASAAATGKKGTSSAKIKTDMRDSYGNPRGGEYNPAKKRK
jgi:hypothetical protein